MIERTPVLDVVTQVLLLLGLVLALGPFVIVAIAASHDLRSVNQVPMPLVPGDAFLANLTEAWTRGGFGQKLLNSLVFALGVAARQGDDRGDVRVLDRLFRLPRTRR